MAEALMMRYSETDTGWINLGRASGVSDATYGRKQGCYYRVINGNHVYVSFTGAISWNGNTFNVNSTPIPEQYRPVFNNAYIIGACDDQYAAKIYVDQNGMIGVEWLQLIPTNKPTTSYSASYIDAQIDYFID